MAPVLSSTSYTRQLLTERPDMIEYRPEEGTGYPAYMAMLCYLYTDKLEDYSAVDQLGSCIVELFKSANQYRVGGLHGCIEVCIPRY